MTIGFGFDSHRLVSGRRLIIGGVEIPNNNIGPIGHSDGDALIHAVIDAILGGLGLGDIGRHFPDSEDRWRDAASTSLLSIIRNMLIENSFEVEWIDSTVILEKPRLSPYIEEMRARIGSCLDIGAERINIKTKTAEGMGLIGSGEGIACFAVCLLKRI